MRGDVIPGDVLVVLAGKGRGGIDSGSSSWRLLPTKHRATTAKMKITEEVSVARNDALEDTNAHGERNYYHLELLSQQ